MDFPSDFTVSELRGHLQLAVGMLEGLEEPPDFVILHDGRSLDDTCELRQISENSPLALSIQNRVTDSAERSIDDECSQITQFTRHLMAHASEEAEFVQQNHLIMENQRHAQAAVMNAWSRYASSPDSVNFIDALISCQGGYSKEKKF